MIALVEQDAERARLLRLCEKTAFGCKIAAVAESYGFDKSFACFWLDTKSEAVFCQSDDLMIISGTVMDAKETGAFLKAAGPRAVMCAVRNAETLSLSASQSGDVLKKKLEPGKSLHTDPYGVNIRDIFGLLEEVGMVEEFEPFYLDLSHKLRHGTALALTEYRGDVLAGCALVSAVSKDSAILSAVAVREDCRRQGIGSALVRRTEGHFAGKTLYVFREKEAHRAFYRDLGYAKADTWVYSVR